MTSTETKAPAPAGARSLSDKETKKMETINDNQPTDTTDTGTDNLQLALSRAVERITTLEEEARSLRYAQITDGSDPRLNDFWDKARRIADHAGFCSEYDKIADALGGPARQYEWSGTTMVEVTVAIRVPIGGIATPSDIQDHTLEYEIDDYMVLEALKDSVENMSRYDTDTWEDREDIEIHHTEPYSD